MKETGLMFKAPLVRAILSGQKTQTRRIVTLRKDWDAGCELAACKIAGEVNGGKYRNSPYAPGNRIYVRETFALHPDFANIAYRADGEAFEDADGFLREPKWITSLLMPKVVARIWLEITSVRVERLQQITDADALAEGVDRTNTSIQGYARERFKTLWESTGGDWTANPWVWVIHFKRLEKP